MTEQKLWTYNKIPKLQLNAQFQFNLKEKPMTTNLSGQVSEFFLEEDRACSNHIIKTKHFTACFSKKELKTGLSSVEES